VQKVLLTKKLIRNLFITRQKSRVTVEMSSSVKITYTLNPPTTVESTGELPKQKSHEFTVTPSSNGGTAGYYTAMRSSLNKARNEVGDELTAWRDRVGKAELNKEQKKGGGDEEEEEEEEVEES
jgi:hypothetical protein